MKYIDLAANFKSFSMTSNSQLMIPEEIIMDKIYLIRDMKVMLDFDLSELYGVETRVLKQAVRRKKRRFPSDFMIELTKEEHDELKRQFGTRQRGRHSKYPPFAFTELCKILHNSVYVN